MQRVMQQLVFLTLSLCFGFCSTAWANTNLPILRPAQGRPTANTWTLTEIPASDLERQLFSDASDGRFDKFSLLDAALIASGISDSGKLELYKKRVSNWCDELRQKGIFNNSPRKQIEILFDFMHSCILNGKYNIASTDLRQALDGGDYNCVSSTVLFNCLAGELGLSCSGLETPGHALSRIYLPDGTLDVQTTCPRWFHLQNDPIKQAEVLEKTIGRQSASDKKTFSEITPIQLTAMIYYNKGVDLLAEKRFADAANANRNAVVLDPFNSTARGNYLATINNWALDLGTKARFSDAVALIRQGLALDPRYEPFKLNFVHLHYQWTKQLCQEANYRDASEILYLASSSMPESDYLRHIVWDVYRRWAQAMLDLDQTDQAFAVFAHAREYYGACQEELHCELSVVIEHGKRLLAQNRHAEAKQLFDRALRLQPDAALLQNFR